MLRTRKGFRQWTRNDQETLKAGTRSARGDTSVTSEYARIPNIGGILQSEKTEHNRDRRGGCGFCHYIHVPLHARPLSPCSHLVKRTQNQVPGFWFCYHFKAVWLWAIVYPHLGTVSSSLTWRKHLACDILLGQSETGVGTSNAMTRGKL